ncbi:hypothetical protein QN277_024928 [Acacia crassicarpa]|uniref:Uncharacterized protein n=1 Tax=Acacia crassicarpa TaxID=499986 RepID=A0AAE1JD91_9FABA|nr:hypothetical protein QN277_024928 [Acacia crassicarpa]
MKNIYRPLLKVQGHRTSLTLISLKINLTSPKLSSAGSHTGDLRCDSCIPGTCFFTLVGLLSPFAPCIFRRSASLLHLPPSCRPRVSPAPPVLVVVVAASVWCHSDNRSFQKL